jgi:hypothetical protein
MINFQTRGFKIVGLAFLGGGEQDIRGREFML